MGKPVLVSGSFVADLAFRSARLPGWGETLMGETFALGPGGKVPTRPLQPPVSALLCACFPRLARTPSVRSRGKPGARLELARAAGVPTILNPAPAPGTPLPDSLIAPADFLIPNESEAALLPGLAAEAGACTCSGQPEPGRASGQAPARCRAGARRGSGHPHPLGSRASLLRRRTQRSPWIRPFTAGAALDTSGAGDAFCGAFVAALAAGDSVEAAARFASAAGGISVTRSGTAASMPTLAEIQVR